MLFRCSFFIEICCFPYGTSLLSIQKKKVFSSFFFFSSRLVLSHIIFYYITSYYDISYHILSYNIISCHHITSSPLIKLHRTHRSCCSNDKASSTASWARSQSPVKWENKKKRNRKKSEGAEKEKKMMRHERKREFIAKKIEHIS